MGKTSRTKGLISLLRHHLKQQAILLNELEREVFRDRVIAMCPATSKQLRRIPGWPKKSATIPELRAVAWSRSKYESVSA